MYGFDIDDTLAKTDWKTSKSQVDAILGARVIYFPTMPFVAITARGSDPKIQAATKTWLKQHFPKCVGVEFAGGSDKQVINEKAQAIQKHGVTDYVDNNINLLHGLQQLLPNVKFYHFDGRKPVAL